jgi:ATP-dependent Clp protease ATP-binding subunit ClpB
MIVRCIDNEIALEIAPDLKDEIATSGYSPVYGARPLRRAVQRLW